MRPLITAEVATDATVALVRFLNGGRNRFHVHTADQVLYITEGDGIVADRSHEHLVYGGDIVHIPAGTEHWHGAQPGKDMAHLNIMKPGASTTVLDS
jgi:quercetin dioxygenase-like cupin family protein